MTESSQGPEALHPLAVWKQRGLVAQTTDPLALLAYLQSPQPRFYCGFDPTADSLHVGHLLLLSMVVRLQRLGAQPFLVVGEATAGVGDPSFKGQERTLKSLDQLRNDAERLRAQLAQWIDFQGPHGATWMNNLDWCGDLRLLPFLREVGKHFSVNAMLQREAIQQRIQRPEVGISYTEFSYALMQAYDYAHLFDHHKVSLQIGGSDQWGNIIAGIQYIQKSRRARVHGWTLPLLLQSNGEKFGKTAHGTLWLDPQKSSPYAFYQFWFQTPDEQVWERIEQLTLETDGQLAEWKAQLKGVNAPQTALADSLTRWIHGAEALRQVQKIRRVFFETGGLQELDRSDLEGLKGCGMPIQSLAAPSADLLTLLVDQKICASLGEAKRQWEQGALQVNEQRWTTEHPRQLEARDAHHGYTWIRKGKKHHLLVEWLKP